MAIYGGGVRPMSKRGRAEADVRRTVAASLVAAGLSHKQAFPLAGYSPKSQVYATDEYRESVAAAREQIREMPGFRLLDTAMFYKAVSDGKLEGAGKIPVGMRLKARMALATLLGQEAPKKVEMNERQEMAALVAVLSRMGPEQLEGESAEEIEDSGRSEIESLIEREDDSALGGS
jgi:hypothetical protein